MSESPGPFAVQTYGPHRQNGHRCELDGELWPCYARRNAPGHYRPGVVSITYAQAAETLAVHTERDGHCSVCGEEWSCAAAVEARRVADRLRHVRAVP